MIFWSFTGLNAFLTFVVKFFGKFEHEFGFFPGEVYLGKAIICSGAVVKIRIRWS